MEIASAVAQRIDALLSRAAEQKHEARVAALRAEFEARTGAFTPSDAFFEARSAAFWDDALTRGGFAGLATEESAFVQSLERSHRGLFFVRQEEDAFLLVDEWSGAEFLIRPTSAGLLDALERCAGLLDGRVIGMEGEIALLPGAVFHAADALAPMRALLPLARERGLGTHEVCDAFLRMDLALRTLSRVKASFAYRKESLPERGGRC